MAIKLDMGKAWNDAVALLSANRDVVLVVAGVFFFLPSAIASLAMPQPTEIEALSASAEPNPEALLGAISAYYGQIWWMFLLIGLVQAIGALCVLALLTDRSRPTVGDALKFGLKALIPYIATQLLVALLVTAVMGVLIGIGALISVAVAALLGLVGVILAIYVWIKLSLATPVIGIEKRLNPLAAMQRSWQLTKGNSLLLLAFYLLLGLVMIVISLIGGMVFAIFGFVGEQVGLFASAIGGALISMGVTAVMLAVLAAVHRQLSGGTSEAVRETFD
ncbi:MAG: glycerophosphoryl diester phosphodiesterase membrane domain-containing protein [Erythrobacter sp.]|nr:MAG: glycerophosphoryl diester phosphodiesterase membrane domain-containing protein [Erythrobacter sp.]